MYRWYILILAALTSTFVLAMPLLSLPALFEEISTEMHLSLVQLGWVWGSGSIMGIVMGLVGGAIGDRFGPRDTLTVVCLLIGIAGAARGFATDFISLATTMFLLGLFTSAVPMNVHKTCGIWFSRKDLGMANGVVSVGMALGFMLGSLLAATTLSPLLGGWRNVFFFYGGVSLLFSILWYMTHTKESEDKDHSSARAAMTWRQSLAHVARQKDVWLVSTAIMAFSACVQGALGYLPLFLRSLEWSTTAADGTASLFHAVSMICAIPIALYSDRIDSRRAILMAGALMLMVGIGILASPLAMRFWPIVIVAVILAGFMRDGYMAVAMTAIMEVKGIGTTFAGTATGLAVTLIGIGNVFSPPLGNSLEQYSQTLPFALWAAMAALGFIIILFYREKRVEVLDVDTRG